MMSFLKSTRAPETADDVALHARLSAIADRGKAQVCLISNVEEPPEPQGVQKRFWTPEEAASGQGRKRKTQ